MRQWLLKMKAENDHDMQNVIIGEQTCVVYYQLHNAHVIKS